MTFLHLCTINPNIQIHVILSKLVVTVNVYLCLKKKSQCVRVREGWQPVVYFDRLSVYLLQKVESRQCLSLDEFRRTVPLKQLAPVR